jgi:threonine/homoserine/homoserine lactone efflux protein
VSAFVEFAAVALVVNVTPGPGMAFIASRAVTDGFRSAMVAQAGLATGILIWVVATVAGAAQLLRASPAAFGVLRGAGALYLAVLGIRLAFTRAQSKRAAVVGRVHIVFVQGLFTNLLNPFIGVFLVTVLPQFTNAERPIAGQIVLLGLWFALSASVVNLTVAALVHRSALSLDDARWVILSRIAGVVLVAFAIKLAVVQLR